MKTKILIIGGWGYIGNRLYHKLKGRFLVTSIDTGKYGRFDYGEYGDHNNLSKRDLSTYDVIIILSGRSSVGSCVNSSLREVSKDNIYAPVNIFEKTDSSQLIIYASSGSLCNTRFDCSENFCHHPSLNLYDYSKAELERIHKERYPERDIVGLRFGTVFGFSDNFRNDTIFNKLFLECFDSGSIQINFPQTYRSFLAMEDLISGIEKVIDCPTKGIFNLASFYSTFGELSIELKKYFLPTRDIQVEYKEEGTNYYNFTLNTKAFNEMFKFEPSIKTIREGIDEMAAKFAFNQIIYCAGRT